MNREIPIFGDEYVDMEFGTGCVKVTPCHDPNDFEMGQRHNLEQILVFNEDATVNANGGKYEGMDRYECRKAVVKDLEEGGYLVKIEDHEHNVGTCYRCGTTVEPMTSAQWFVKMAPLAKPAIGRGKRRARSSSCPTASPRPTCSWMENVHDWCISRQLWWGHRIPACYCDDCGEMTVSKTDVRTCPKCGSKHIRQEEDVLDTWFSSALWPFSTLGWPDKTKELDYFYPTSTLVTGYDIIFFWVARMIFSGVEHMGEAPFKTVLYPRSGARRAGPQDVQVARQRHRPAGGHRPVRRGRAALHPCNRQQPRKRYAFLGRAAYRRQPQLLPTRSGTHPALSR